MFSNLTDVHAGNGRSTKTVYSYLRHAVLNQNFGSVSASSACSRGESSIFRFALKHVVLSASAYDFLNQRFDPQNVFYVMKINNCRMNAPIFRLKYTTGCSDQDINRQKDINSQNPGHNSNSRTSSVADLAEVSFSSPRKLFIFTIKKYILLDQSIQKKNQLNFEKNFTAH